MTLADSTLYSGSGSRRASREFFRPGALFTYFLSSPSLIIGSSPSLNTIIMKTTTFQCLSFRPTLLILLLHLVFFIVPCHSQTNRLFQWQFANNVRTFVGVLIDTALSPSTHTMILTQSWMTGDFDIVADMRDSPHTSKVLLRQWLYSGYTAVLHDGIRSRRRPHNHINRHRPEQSQLDGQSRHQ